MQGIYAIVNKVNGRRYIGSSTDIRWRWYAHRSSLKCQKHLNQHLQRAWNKYGADAFEFVMLEEVASIEELVVREQFHIDANVDGYNMGDAGASFRGRKHTADAIEKMRQHALTRAPISAEARERANTKKRGRKQLAEHVEKRAAALRGRPGKPQTEESKEKIREARKRQVYTVETRKKMSESAKQCKQTAESRAHMSAMLTGKPWSAKRRAAHEASKVIH